MPVPESAIPVVELASTVVERLQAYGTLGAVRRASIRAAYQTASSGSFDGSTERLVQAVDEARYNKLVQVIADVTCMSEQRGELLMRTP